LKNAFKTTLLIPGNWKDIKDFIVSLANGNNYLFVGFLLMKLETRETFPAELSQDWSAEEYLTEFAPLFPNQPLEQPFPIHSVFMIEADTGSLQQLEKLCDIISEVLRIGGYGVKIVNSGKVIPRNIWEGLSYNSQTLFELFISIYPVDKGIRTCGMSNFGKRDVFVPLKPDDEGIEFILSYAWYIISEQAVVQEGETFSSSNDAPIFKIFEAEDDNEPEHPFYNPFGLWKVWPQEWLEK
jgi:Domain of unknown function (DUF4261)